MIKDSEKYKEQDQRKRENIETRQEGEALIHATEKMVAMYKDKVDENTISTITNEIEELKILVRDNNSKAIRIKIQDIQRVSQEIGIKIYQQTAAENAKNKKVISL